MEIYAMANTSSQTSRNQCPAHSARFCEFVPSQQSMESGGYRSMGAIGTFNLKIAALKLRCPDLAIQYSRHWPLCGTNQGAKSGSGNYRLQVRV